MTLMLSSTPILFVVNLVHVGVVLVSVSQVNTHLPE